MARADQPRGGDRVVRQGLGPGPDAAVRRLAEAALVVGVDGDALGREIGRRLLGEAAGVFVEAMQREDHGAPRYQVWLPRPGRAGARPSRLNTIGVMDGGEADEAGGAPAERPARGRRVAPGQVWIACALCGRPVELSDAVPAGEAFVCPDCGVGL